MGGGGGEKEGLEGARVGEMREGRRRKRGGVNGDEKLMTFMAGADEAAAVDGR